MARPAQSVLKRDENNNVVNDDKGRPVRVRIVKASGSKFRRGKSAESGAVVTRKMTEEELERYVKPAKKLSYEERKRIGQEALLNAASERRFLERQ